MKLLIILELILFPAADLPACPAQRSFYLQDSNKRVNMWPSAGTVSLDLWAVRYHEVVAQMCSEILKIDKYRIQHLSVSQFAMVS